VCLSKNFECQARKLIINQNPGIESDFSVSITQKKLKEKDQYKELSENAISNFAKHKIDNLTCYSILLPNGYGFTIKVDKKDFSKLEDGRKKLRLKKEGFGITFQSFI
jgi:hypothetical protein